MPTKQTTDFGYQQVPLAEKGQRVEAVFSSVAKKYDLMNDLMSLGLHRLWKRFAVSASQVKRGQRVLDLAGGTGDLTALFAERVGKEGLVCLADINAAMLAIGRDHLTDQGFIQNIRYFQANAELLPFSDDVFDCVSIAFGLRNVTDKMAALKAMYRVLKPGGQLLVLEFSKPLIAAFKTIYDIYSFSVLPKLGNWVVGDVASYQYLAESIRMHPDQEVLKSIIFEAGFDECDYHNLSGGIVALHKAWKF